MNNLAKLMFIMLTLTPAVAWSQLQISGRSGRVVLHITGEAAGSDLEIVKGGLLFIDNNNNDRIDGLENTNIIIPVINRSQTDASNIAMNILLLSATEGLDFAGRQIVPVIPSGKKINLSIPIDANLNLQDGIARFRIIFEGIPGQPTDSVDFQKATRAYKQPLVKVSDFEINAPNGRIIPGQQYKVSTLIQNTGQGIAEDVVVQFRVPEGKVLAMNDDKFFVGMLQPNQSRQVDFEFAINRLYDQPNLPVEIMVTEKHGRFAESTTRETPVEKHTGPAPEKQTAAVTPAQPDQEITIRRATLKPDTDTDIPENKTVYPSRYALVIGNEDYTTFQPGLDAESNVPFAISDAEIFARYAEKTLGVPLRNIFLLRNAIGSQMIKEIKRLSKLIEIENGQAEVFFFYAGHAEPNRQTGCSYLMPVDISAATLHLGIPVDSLYADLTRHPAQRITVFLDACFSGGGRSAGLLSERGVKILPREEPLTGNIVVFTASKGTQSAGQHKEMKHGLFTYHLLKTLQETKGNVTYGEMFERIRRSVELDALRVNGKEQSPSVLPGNSVAKEWDKWVLYN